MNSTQLMDERDGRADGSGSRVEPPRARPPVVDVLLGLIERLGLVGMLVAMVVLFAVHPTSGPVFTSSANVSNLLGDQAVVGLVALVRRGWRVALANAALPTVVYAWW